MKTFIILQKIVSFRINWHTLYNPHSYQLILIVHEPTLSKLAEDQKSYFAQIHRVENFNKESLQVLIHKIIQENDEVGVITNDELCINLAAELREQFNFPGDRIAMVDKFLNKEENKKLVARQNITLPKYERFNHEQYKNNPEHYAQQLIQKLGLPIFAKPIDSAASQFTCKINSATELQKWCMEHMHDDNYELDEFINGKLIQCDSIIKNNEILFAQVNENAHPCFDFMSGKITGGITLPNTKIVSEILEFNQKVLIALRPIPDCVTHLEIFQRSNGELVFLEIACRAPGGMIVQMHEKHTGINVEQAHFALQMGLEFDVNHYQVKGPYCAWAWFPLEEGKVIGLRALDIKSPHEIFWKIKPGEVYQKAKSLIDFAGGVILWNDNYDELRKDFDYLAQLK